MTDSHPITEIDAVGQLVESLSWLVEMTDASPLPPTIPDGDPLTRLLWILEHNATADEVPPCRVCGGELSIQRMGGGPTKWAHASPDGVRMSDWSDHYQASEWYARREGDGNVLALVQYVRATAISSGRSQDD